MYFMRGKRKMASTAVFCMLLTALFFTKVIAENFDQNEYKDIITITEKNGKNMSDYFVRRSIPLSRGELYDADNLCVKGEGVVIPCDAEVMERYEDGSVRWLLISFVTDLLAKETKSFDLDFSQRTNSSLWCEKIPGRILATNKDVGVSVTEDGIGSILYNGQSQLNDGGIRLYAKVDGVEYFQNQAEISLIKNEDSYIKIKISGRLDSDISGRKIWSDNLRELLGEMYITIPSVGAKIETEYRITAKGKVKISSAGLKIFTDYNGENKHSTDIIADCDNGMQIISYDNERFAGAVDGMPGFTYTNGCVQLSPIINQGNFVYYDGVSRTNHVYFCFDGEGDALAAAVKNPPKVVINPGQFVKSGIIKNDTTSVLVEDAIESICSIKDKMNGFFEAGALPKIIDVKRDRVKIQSSRPGESEYNLGIAYMATGNDVIYNIMCESAESRADVCVYKGRYPEIYGAVRYQSYKEYGNAGFFSTHPYYGDESGLYMAYILSGNEYLHEVFIATVEHMVESNMYINKNWRGTYAPHRWKWSEDDTSVPQLLTFVESRYMINARSLYLAYINTGDEKFRTAAFDILKWAEVTQNNDGSWYQAYYDNGNVLVQGGQAQYPKKNDIMLYGYRGLAEILKWEPYDTQEAERLRSLTLKFAEFICKENELYGPGMISPTGNWKVYETNEDYSRGMSPMFSVMALDVLLSAYTIEKSDRYLENIMSLTEYFLYTNSGGLGFDKIAMSGYIDTDLCPDTRAVLFKFNDTLMDIMSREEEKIKELGYGDVYSIIMEDTIRDERTLQLMSFTYPYISMNVYANKTGKYFWAMNCLGNANTVREKELEICVPDGKLWTGIPNVYDNGRLFLKKRLDELEGVNGKETALTVSDIRNDDVEINIVRYDKEAIVIDAFGTDYIEFTAEDGVFPIKSGAGYCIVTSSTENGMRVTVKAGGETAYATDGALIVKMDSGQCRGFCESFDGFDEGNFFDAGWEVKDYPSGIEKFPGTNNRSLIVSGGDIGQSVVKSICDSDYKIIGADFCPGEAISVLPELFSVTDDVYKTVIGTAGLKVNCDYQKWLSITFAIDNINKTYSAYVNWVEKITNAPYEEKALRYIKLSGISTYYNADNVYCECFSSKEQMEERIKEIQNGGLSHWVAECTKQLDYIGGADISETAKEKVKELRAMLTNRVIPEKKMNSVYNQTDKLCSILNAGRELIFMDEFDFPDEDITHRGGDIVCNSEVLVARRAKLDADKGVLCVRDGQSELPQVTSRYMLRSTQSYQDCTVEFDFMQPVKCRMDEICMVSDRVGYDIAALLDSDGENIRYYYGELQTNGNYRYSVRNLIENYQANQWYSFKLYINNTTDTYDIYVDGKKIVDDAPFATVRGGYNKAYDISRFFRVGTRYIGENYYDNMYVYTGDVIEEELSLKYKEGFLETSENCNYDKKQLYIAVYDEKGTLQMLKAGGDNASEFTMDTSALGQGQYRAKVFLWNPDALKPLTRAKSLGFYID